MSTPSNDVDAAEKGQLDASPTANKGFGKDKAEKDRADVVSVKSVMASTGEINYKSMSWQKCAGLLFGEYVCLAILSFPYAYQTLGMAGGILTTLLLGIVNLYTSLKLHAYCLKYPHLINIADIGQHIFGNSKIAYELTALALILNNTFLMGLHTLTGAEIINTLAEPRYMCSVAASVVIMVVSIIGTLPRKLEQVALMGIVSASEFAFFLDLVPRSMTSKESRWLDRGTKGGREAELCGNKFSKCNKSSARFLRSVSLRHMGLLKMASSVELAARHPPNNVRVSFERCTGIFTSCMRNSRCVV